MGKLFVAALACPLAKGISRQPGALSEATTLFYHFGREYVGADRSLLAHQLFFPEEVHGRVQLPLRRYFQVSQKFAMGLLPICFTRMDGIAGRLVPRPAGRLYQQYENQGQYRRAWKCQYQSVPVPRSDELQQVFGVDRRPESIVHASAIAGAGCSSVAFRASW